MPAKMHPPSRAWPAPTEPFDVHRELLGVNLPESGKKVKQLRTFF